MDYNIVALTQKQQLQEKKGDGSGMGKQETNDF